MPHEKTPDRAELLRQVAEWNQRSYMAAQPQGNEAELRRLIIEWIKAQYECLVPSSEYQTRKDYLAFDKAQAALRRAVTGRESVSDAARVLTTVDVETI